MAFDLSTDFGRCEKEQFELIERYCYSLEFTIKRFEERIALVNKDLDKGKSLDIAEDLEQKNFLESYVVQLKSLLSRAERLKRDTNTFYRKHYQEVERIKRRLMKGFLQDE
jgi:hypothetical protein